MKGVCHFSCLRISISCPPVSLSFVVSFDWTAAFSILEITHLNTALQTNTKKRIDQNLWSVYKPGAKNIKISLGKQIAFHPRSSQNQMWGHW